MSVNEDCIKVYFNNIEFMLSRGIVERYLIGSVDFLDGYCYEVPEGFDNIEVDIFVMKLMTFLRKRSMKYRDKNFQGHEISAPLLAFLDKYVKMDDELICELAIINDTLHNILHDYHCIHTFCVYGYDKYYKARFFDKVFNNTAKIVFKDKEEFFEKYSFDINDQHRITIRYRSFWNGVGDHFAENIYEILYKIHLEDFQDIVSRDRRETFEMYSYMMCKNYSSR